MDEGIIVGLAANVESGAEVVILNLNYDHAPQLCIFLQPSSARNVRVAYRLSIEFNQGWGFCQTSSMRMKKG